MKKEMDKNSNNGNFAFSAVNYKLLGLGLVLLVVGYILMSGGGLMIQMCLARRFLISDE